MPNTTPTILLTRPLAQSKRFANDLGDANVVISPVLAVQYRDLAVDPRAYDALIFTSENGVRAAAAATDLHGMQGYAVGPRTAEVGAEFGLDLAAARGTADDLVPMILQDRQVGRLLHLRGAHSRGDVAKRLTDAGLETDFAIAYDQLALPLNTQALHLLGAESPVLLPIFSPRTAALLGPMCAQARAPLTLIAMSDAVLQAWAGPELANSVVVAEPSGNAMLQEILRQIRRVA